MKNLKITQQTIPAGESKETIISVNGCSIVHAVFKRDLHDFGFKVISFVAGDNSKVVDSGSSWSDVRTKARKYAKENFARHAAYHNL